MDTTDKFALIGAKSIMAEYLENEDNNAHTENYVMLARYFGSDMQLHICKEILERRNREGSLSQVDNDWLYKHINPYYYELKKMIKEYDL